MEDFEDPDIQIQDVMTLNPTIVKTGETVKHAAALMKEAGVGSLLVLDEEGKLQGIVTEMDIVFDTVAEGLDPEKVKIEEIMSSPVHTIEGTKNIDEGAKIMAKLGIRRLPVTKDGEFVGLITENDIIELSPALLDVTREVARIKYGDDIEVYEEPARKEISGYCESCSIYSDRLTVVNGQLLCPECYKE